MSSPHVLKDLLALLYHSCVCGTDGPGGKGWGFSGFRSKAHPTLSVGVQCLFKRREALWQGLFAMVTEILGDKRKHFNISLGPASKIKKYPSFLVLQN